MQPLLLGSGQCRSRQVLARPRQTLAAAAAAAATFGSSLSRGALWATKMVLAGHTVFERRVNSRIQFAALQFRCGYDYWLASNMLEFTSEAYQTTLYDAQDRPVQLPGYRADACTDAAIRYVHEQYKAQVAANAAGETGLPFFLFIVRRKCICFSIFGPLKYHVLFACIDCRASSSHTTRTALTCVLSAAATF